MEGEEDKNAWDDGRRDVAQSSSFSEEEGSGKLVSKAA